MADGQTHPPPFKGREATIRFNTTIVLPVLEGDAPLSIKQFSTDLHYTGLSFADLGKTVLFESLLLQGLVAPVNAKVTSAPISVPLLLNNVNLLLYLYRRYPS